MAVETINAYSGPYIANGVTTSFPFTFSAMSGDDVTVLLRDANGVDTVVSAVNYTVALTTAVPSAGTVTFATAPATGNTVLLLLDLDFTQETQFENGSPWLASPVNNANDRAALRDQMLKREVDRTIKSPLGEDGLTFPTVSARAGKYLAFDSNGNLVPSNGMGADAALRNDLAAPGGAALNGYKRSSAAQAETIDTVLKRFVFAASYGYVGPSGDSSIAINAAILDCQLTGGGGDVILPPGTNRTDNPIIIGDGTAGVHSTYGAIKLRGSTSPSGIGANNPLGGSAIKSYYAGPAIDVRGRIEGWGIENLFIRFGTTNALAVGIQVTEATRGYSPGVTIVDPPGGGVVLTTRNENNVESNVFPGLNIWLGTTYVNFGVKLTAGSGGTVGNASHNSFPDLMIIPGKAGQIGVWLQCCGTNYFYNYVCKSFDSAVISIYLDYSVNNTWPVNNLFVNADWHGTSIVQNGSPSATYPFPNRITGLTQDNSARIPRISGLTVDRIKLSSNATFFVSNAGTDTGSTGIYAAGPLATVQRAYDWIATQYDLNGYDAIIQVAAGSYEGLDASIPTVGGKVIVQGAGGATEFNGALCPIRARDGVILEVRDVYLNCLLTQQIRADGGTVRVGSGVVFGGAPGFAQVFSNGGTVRLVGNYSIFKGALSHLDVRRGGKIIADSGLTVTFTANAAYTVAFASGATCGATYLPTMTFVLGAFAVTGSRYAAVTNCVIDTNGGGASYLPGNSAGSVATGGQYA